MVELVGGANDDLLEWAFVPGDGDSLVMVAYERIDGGAGVDTLSFRGDAVVRDAEGRIESIDLARGLVFSTSLGAPIPIANVENVTMLSYSGVSLIGDDAANRLEGLDLIFHGGGGDDTLVAEEGVQAVYGDGGRDTVVLDGLSFDPDLEEEYPSFRNYHIDLGREVILSDGFNLGKRPFVSIENVIIINNVRNSDQDPAGDPARIVGSDRANHLACEAWENTLFGAGGNDTLDGGLDADRLWGDANNDVVAGSFGDDSLKGGEGKDAIDGGEGEDRLYGEGGRDTMTGGEGADRFVFRDGEADYVAGAQIAHADRIADFSQAEGDLIDLRGVAGRPDSGFTFIGAEGFSGSAGELRAVQYGAGITMVFGDRDGDATADLAIRIENGAIALTEADFLI